MVAALVRGDHEINELKLQSRFEGCRELTLADEATVASATRRGTGISRADRSETAHDRRSRRFMACAARSPAPTRPMRTLSKSIRSAILRRRPLPICGLPVAGDPCPRCETGVLETHRGIEVGQVFYLGTKYSEAMGATYLDAEGRERPIEMGCYGIGISRLVAAAIEQNHDANGIIWPFSIAPFQVLLLPINYKDKRFAKLPINSIKSCKHAASKFCSMTVTSARE